MNVRNKGNRGERAWRDVINTVFHVQFARTPLSGGLDLKGDLLRKYGSPKSIADEFHWEVKRVEKLNIHKALQQAIRDSRPPLIPCVVFRRNNEDWRITLQAKDFLNILVELQDLRQNPKKKESDFEKWVKNKEAKRIIRQELKKEWAIRKKK